MNNITQQTANEAVTFKHREYILEKTFSFFQPILMDFISRITSININRTINNTSVQLSFDNDYPKE